MNVGFKKGFYDVASKQCKTSPGGRLLDIESLRGLRWKNESDCDWKIFFEDDRKIKDLVADV